MVGRRLSYNSAQASFLGRVPGGFLALRSAGDATTLGTTITTTTTTTMGWHLPALRGGGLA
jgi:hypothetical protein